MTIEQIALSYLGQTEKSGNMGFNDPAFERKMTAVGFQKKQAWCAYFTELVAKEAYPEKFEELDSLFSASAVQTFRNFRDAGYPIRELPEPGALAIWQRMKNGKATWQGHAGIVVSFSGTRFESVEGNTNDHGGREGYIVARHSHEVRKVREGLQVLGFIKVA